MKICEGKWKTKGGMVFNIDFGGTGLYYADISENGHDNILYYDKDGKCYGQFVTMGPETHYHQRDVNTDYAFKKWDLVEEEVVVVVVVEENKEVVHKRNSNPIFMLDLFTE